MLKLSKLNYLQFGRNTDLYRQKERSTSTEVWVQISYNINRRLSLIIGIILFMYFWKLGKLYVLKNTIVYNK